MFNLKQASTWKGLILLLSMAVDLFVPSAGGNATIATAGVVGAVETLRNEK